MDNNLTAADIAAVMGNNRNYGCYGDGMFGGDSWAWIILVILLGGGGLWGNNRDGRCATVEDVNNSANFTRLENQVRFNENAIQNGFSNTFNGIANLGYRELENFSTLRYDNAIGQKELAAQIAACCCETKGLIQAEGAATRALIQENKIEALRDKVSALELQGALCGVVRYPTGMTYTAGTSPFCATACGCGNI